MGKNLLFIRWKCLISTTPPAKPAAKSLFASSPSPSHTTLVFSSTCHKPGKSCRDITTSTKSQNACTNSLFPKTQQWSSPKMPRILSKEISLCRIIGLPSFKKQCLIMLIWEIRSKGCSELQESKLIINNFKALCGLFIALSHHLTRVSAWLSAKKISPMSWCPSTE